MIVSIYQTPQYRVDWAVPPSLSPEKAFLFENKGRLKILEVGCAEIAVRNYFEQRGHQFTGLDLISNKADIHGDMNFLPFSKTEFDAVYINATLQYSLSPLQTFVEIHRVLRNGGFVAGSIAFLEPGVWKSLCHLTPRGLHEMMRRAGFEVLNIWPSWNVIDALVAAIDNDQTISDKKAILNHLKKIQGSEEYNQLVKNVNYAGGLNFHGVKPE